jgi:hypothetical protein
MKISQMFHISPILFTACASFTAIAQYPRSSHALSSTISSNFESRVERTGSILAAADLDEALDVGDFAGHVGGIV